MPSAHKSRLYRILEIFPGFLTWGTLLGAVVFSYVAPFWVAIYIILFDLYWVLKAINTSLHLMSTFRKWRLYRTYDWNARLHSLARGAAAYKSQLRREILSSATRRRDDLKQELFRLDNIDFTDRITDYQKIYHVVLLTTYNESLEVLDNSVRSVIESDFPKDQIIFVLACEERDGARGQENARILRERYGHQVFKFIATFHPDGIIGEIKAKGANLTYACREVLPVLASLQIPVDNVIVSAFDSDTVVSKNYLAYLTYAFLTAEKPYRTSYQPLQVYNNNIWDAPAITRIVAVANSFWQMVEASRPDRVVTFSSHAMTLRALIDVDFWPVDTIPDDSRIFWRAFLRYDGDYRTQPLFIHVSLDAVLDDTYKKSLIGQYKQKRRWAWGVCEIPYVITGFIKNKKIPLWKKFLYGERLIEGHYFWATASIMIAVLGWLPLLLGGNRFEESVLALNLPTLTRVMMQTATIFLIFSVYINMVLLPRRPRGYSRWKTATMLLQWVFTPIVSTVFGSLPAIDAQTRLMLGKYMEFWVTPKHRKILADNNKS